ncbi:hypothetical protein Pelo_3422 [Pelomyxa schiedti]|nr:hypothetical protein Pelo_3422 [Pelomyxa schiedti]
MSFLRVSDLPLDVVTRDGLHVTAHRVQRSNDKAMFVCKKFTYAALRETGETATASASPPLVDVACGSDSTGYVGDVEVAATWGAPRRRNANTMDPQSAAEETVPKSYSNDKKEHSSDGESEGNDESEGEELSDSCGDSQSETESGGEEDVEDEAIGEQLLKNVKQAVQAIERMPQHKNLLRYYLPLKPNPSNTTILAFSENYIGTLEDKLHREETMSGSFIKANMSEVLTGLRVLHQQGIAHGELSLSNIVEMPDGTFKFDPIILKTHVSARLRYKGDKCNRLADLHTFGLIWAAIVMSDPTPSAPDCSPAEHWPSLRHEMNPHTSSDNSVIVQTLLVSKPLPTDSADAPTLQLHRPRVCTLLYPVFIVTAFVVLSIILFSGSGEFIPVIPSPEPPIEP